MRAVVVEAPEDPPALQLREWPDPEPKSGELLVAVSHAGVNFADVVMRQTSTSPFPMVPGVEGAGIVREVGEGVEGFAPGDRVAWAPVKRGASIGSYAELTAVGAEQAVRVPEALSLETASASILQGLTACYLVNDICPLGPGRTVLVHAGAGGTGRMAIQWATHLGAEVLATVGSDEKAEVARRAGADHVIVYTRDDFVAAARDLTDGRGVDYIIDGVVGSTFAGDLRAVADRGTICVLGRAAGLPEPFSPMRLVARSITVTGGYMSNFLREREEVLQKAASVWTGIADGWLVPLVHSVHPLEDAAEAHRLLQGRDTVGKVVLRVAGE